MRTNMLDVRSRSPCLSQSAFRAGVSGFAEKLHENGDAYEAGKDTQCHKGRTAAWPLVMLRISAASDSQRHTLTYISWSGPIRIK